MENEIIKDIIVLKETKDYIFVKKPVGILSEGEHDSMVGVLGEKIGKVFCVHRLDRAVSGIMVYAKNKRAASYISSVIESGKMEKEYLAVVHGNAGEGEMTDLLFKDSKNNKSYVVKRERKGVRKARLEYKTIAEKDDLSLVKIKLDTGRSHQIRVQFSSRKFPLYGDGKYGASDNSDIALFSHKLSFPLETGEIISETVIPDFTKPWDKFKEYITEDN